MIRKQFWIFLFSLLSLTGTLSAQKLSDKATISLLTCGPGRETYSLFGHCAVHVSDPITGIDKVYNYGTFNFEDNFVMKFARGKLRYYVSTETLSRFLAEYKHDQRWVKEQFLNLNPAETGAVFRKLENNALPENKYYLYDFFFDNCASRIRDIVQDGLGDQLEFDYTFKEKAGKQTYRDLIDPYLTYFPWTQFGIDLGLGSVVDKEVEGKNYMFLPDYLMEAFGAAYVKRDGNYLPLVIDTKQLVPPNTEPMVVDPFYMRPNFIFWMLFFVVLGLTLLGITKGRNMYWIDVFFLFIYGLVGWFVLLLWFATDHDATKLNLNVMWLMPLHLFAAILLVPRKRTKWLTPYFVLTGTLTLVTVVGWFFLPQQFNGSFLPLMLLILMRQALLPGKLQQDWIRKKAKLEANA